MDTRYLSRIVNTALETADLGDKELSLKVMLEALRDIKEEILSEPPQGEALH